MMPLPAAERARPRAQHFPQDEGERIVLNGGLKNIAAPGTGALRARWLRQPIIFASNPFTSGNDIIQKNERK